MKKIVFALCFTLGLTLVVLVTVALAQADIPECALFDSASWEASGVPGTTYTLTTQIFSDGAGWALCMIIDNVVDKAIYAGEEMLCGTAEVPGENLMGTKCVPPTGHLLEATQPITITVVDTDGLGAGIWAKTVVSPTELSNVEITGPVTGTVGADYTFTASISPITATLPVTYTWQSSAGVREERQHGVADVVEFSWDTPGPQVVTLVADNGVGEKVFDFVVIDIAPVPPESVEITGPVEGLVNTTYAFTAQVSPVSTTLPISYVWQVDGQEPVTHTSGLTDEVDITWASADQYTVTVSASNAGGEVTDSHVVTITQPVVWLLYLPLTVKDYCPAPSSVDRTQWEPAHAVEGLPAGQSTIGTSYVTPQGAGNEVLFTVQGQFLNARLAGGQNLSCEVIENPGQDDITYHCWNCGGGFADGQEIQVEVMSTGGDTTGYVPQAELSQ